MDEKSKSEALIRTLSSQEVEALRNLARGGSMRDLARSLAIDVAEATEIKKAMMLKLGAVRDSDAVRVALYAGIC